MASAITTSAPAPIALRPGAVPEWVMLARTGAWLGHPAAPEVVEPRHLGSALDYFERHYAAHGTDLVIDYGHSSMAAPSGRAPAAGWVNRMELRGGGEELWGRVLWTTEAAGAIARREYRYLSPVFRFDRPDRLTGESVPLQIHSVALTNTPFLTELEGLNTAADDGGPTPTEGGTEMPILQGLAAALEEEPAELAGRLGLEADAEDRAVAEALMANAETTAADRAALVQLRAAAAALRARLHLAEDATEQDVLNALDAAARRSDAEELVDGAVREGRVPPAHRDFYLREALGDLRAARDVINSLPVLTAPQPVPPVRTAGALTDGEEAVRRQLGLTTEQMLAARSK
jgi:phage I-like protein